MVNNFEEFRKDVSDALKQVCNKYNLQLELKNIRYDNVHLDLAATFNDKGKDGDADYNLFCNYCKLYGLTPSDYNKKIIIKGETYYLCGFANKARKYKAIVKNSEGKKFGVILDLVR